MAIATDRANVGAARAPFAPRALCIDIETAHDDPFRLHKLAAWRSDTGVELLALSRRACEEAAGRLDALAQGAACVLGHNILQHDLPVLARHFPSLRLHDLPVVDTLLLSPIAFPQNPYHRLVKDYRLVRDARSDPLRDARLALQLWHEQKQAFEVLGRESADELACHHYLLNCDRRLGVGALFAVLRHALVPPMHHVRAALARLVTGKVCATQADAVLDACLADPELALPLAYLLAWLRVSGGNSVIPPWVRLQFPRVRELQRRLRDTACQAAACGYCRERMDPRRELERHFGFASFRAEPRTAEGGSLQEAIVRAAYARRSLLAILPTGGGKSLCYQLPGLSSHWRNGGLTVIVSPLQSLMKDQVDNLVRQGVYTTAALNGLLSMPERRVVLDGLRLGDVGVVLVSPEQFRNRSFTEAIRHREIAAWVFDEAHCLSRWGNDFRPDYLYVSRHIRTHHAADLAPVWCYTATARREVVEDLRKHFREALGVELEVFDGGHERANLQYEVMQATAAEKLPLIQSLLRHELADPVGGAIVFAATRKRCEELAAGLKDAGWACAHFHAGLEAGLKKDIQQDFIANRLRVIVATNAFGMGVDKPNVRLVVHAEMPGSLENYLQEAGRAGRDNEQARCVLLYDQRDVEKQFSIAARSRLSRRDIAGILRSLRRYSARLRSDAVVVTPGEILAGGPASLSIELGERDADTRVRAAVAWLERARLLERNENHVRVFPGSLRVNSLEAADQRLARADLSAAMRDGYRQLVSELVNADDDEGLSTDDLAVRLGVPPARCLEMLRELDRLEILANDIEMTVLLRHGIPDASLQRFQVLCAAEAALLGILPELAPDAAEEGWQGMDLRALRQRVAEAVDGTGQADGLLAIVRSLARPFGDGEGARRPLFDVRVLHREILRVRLRRSWAEIVEIAARRREVAGVLMQALLGQLAPQLRGADLRVVCKAGELETALKNDLAIGPGLKDVPLAIEAGLLYLHDNGVLILDRGKSVFRAAMTLHLQADARRRQFSQADYVPLADHYREKNFQVHVIQEYARLGLARLSDALAFVLAYFSLPRQAFIRRYFAGRREILERATTHESWQRIVEDLRHPVQQALVTGEEDANRLVLAGPGSGKTRVIVHRVAYLVRIQREAAESVLVLAYNRAAAWEIRQRLVALVGADARGVSVLTYHALALRLTGRSFAASAGTQDEPVDFDAILDDALALLEGRRADAAGDVPDLPDEEARRERLLAGYRHILVDEYQDVDERQYRLISALAGRRLADAEAKLDLLAVGDDDQNIYAFRGTSNAFIRRFQDDYEAAPEYLVENYRSSGHIIAAANAIVGAAQDRLKRDHPIRINHARRDDPPGGRWSAHDALAQGRVMVLATDDDATTQAAQVMAELERIRALAPGISWSGFAVLARKHASLEPVRAWCELAGVPVRELEAARGQPRLTQTRETWALLDLLRARPGRSLSGASLVRWFERHFRGGRSDNPWEGLLRQYIDELAATWGSERIPAGTAVEALFEFAQDVRRAGGEGLVISTVHGAKGSEFNHVAMLDGGEWREGDDEERRLYYVGMTRARETLLLCQAARCANPFTPALAGAAILRASAVTPTALPAALSHRHLSLGLRDVDLGFAGRYAAASPVHQALARLRVGDALGFEDHAGRRELRAADGVVVGRLAAAARLPPGKVLRASVGSLVVWTAAQNRPGYRETSKVDRWLVVLPKLVVAPAS